jgi:hypothetical protein
MAEISATSVSTGAVGGVVLGAVRFGRGGTLLACARTGAWFVTVRYAGCGRAAG